MDQGFLDILNSCSSLSDKASPGANKVKAGPLIPALTARDDLGSSIQVPSEIIPANASTSIERFRSVSSNLMANANMSVDQEIMRIVNLPIILDPTEEEIRLISNRYIFDSSPPFDKGLFPEQVKGLMQYHDHGNLFCPIKVGGGKTLLCVLIANDAYREFGKRKIILINPPNLIDQLKNTELPLYRRHISINVPFHWLTKEPDRKRRMMLAKSNKGGCYVLSYSLLSSQDGAEIMDAIQPDLMIPDEVHRIASARPSARNRRFKEIVEKYSPNLVVLSGTISKRSPKDFHYIATKTLKENCFMPRPTHAAEAWSEIIYSGASSVDDLNHNSGVQAAGPIMRVNRWAIENFEGEEFPGNLLGFRVAAKKRMHTCPGVIASEGEGTVPLRITNIVLSENDYTSRPGWDRLEEIVKTLLLEYVAPNGDEIDHAMHIWRWRYELEGFGFYNNLVWPDVNKLVEHRNIHLTAAQDLLDRSMEQHDALNDYRKLLRAWLKHFAKTGIDTPMLVGQRMYINGANDVGQELYDAWCKERDLKFEGMLERERSVVRVCDFRVNKIVEWAKAWHKKRPNKASIMWYYNNGAGKWLYEAFLEADLPVLYCPRGDKGMKLIDDRTKGNHFAIASSSFKEGRNLQHHHDTEFFAQWYRQADWIEQAMGRIDRSGQMSDQARYFTCISSEFDRMLFACTLNDAAYTHQTISSHKLMYADFDVRPTVIPYGALLEWSGGKFSPQQLSSENQNMLLDKFRGN